MKKVRPRELIYLAESDVSDKIRNQNQILLTIPQTLCQLECGAARALLLNNTFFEKMNIYSI